MGELHLEYIIDRLFTHYGVSGVVGRIMIAYRCALKSETEKTVNVEHEYETPTGKRTYGRVRATIASLPLERSCEYVNVADGVSVDWANVGAMTSDDKKAIASFTEVFGICCFVFTLSFV
jgi:translation elongation factor EF-G